MNIEERLGKLGIVLPAPMKPAGAYRACVEAGGMVYVAGRQSHKMTNDQMIDHIVELVEGRAAEIEAAKEAAE